MKILSDEKKEEDDKDRTATLQSIVASLSVPGIMNDDYPTKTMYACGHCLQSTGQPSWLCWWWSPGTVLGTPVLQQTLKSVNKRQKQTKTKQAKYVWKLSPSVKNGLKMQKVSTKIHSVHYLRKSGNSSLLPIVKKN